MKNKIIYIIVCFLFGTQLKAQTLQEYLHIAEKNSPELQASSYSYQSALEKVEEVGSLPNTTIGAGYFVQEAETRVGAQKAKLSANQMLPWFGTFSAKKESASFSAQAKLNSVDITKRNLFLNVKTAYFNLYELKSKETVLNENLDLLKTFERLALSELENNKATMVDVLKIQMKQNEILNDLNTVHENLQAKKRTFNLLLNRNEDALIEIIDSITINEIDPINKDLIANNPKLLELNNLQNALVKMETATKKEGLPSIGIGLDYIFVENRAIDNLADNGKDIIMPMVSVSIPLFSKKYSSKQKQLQLDQKAIESSKTTATNQLNMLFETALANLKTAKASVETQNKNIAQANQAEKVLLAAYQVAKIDFDQILEIQQLKLKFQLKKIAAEKEYAIQKATLEFLTINN